ncbi:MAG: patatin-like phospholipase family protein, partial [Bacteroidota bacterium]
WLTDLQHDVHMIGASSGSWRMSCAAQSNPLTAEARLFEAYVEQTYEEIPTADEISEVCRGIVAAILGENGVEDILAESHKKLHVITSRASQDRPVEKIKMQMASAFLSNFFSRKKLGNHFERYIFSNTAKVPIRTLKEDLETISVRMNAANIPKAMLASGAIPTLISPVTEIDGAPGQHWDGGVTDYQIDLPFDLDDGLLLYPHFHGKIIPGWLDKFVPWRKAQKINRDRLVFMYPSEEFVASLPYKRIVDRKDFNRFFQRDAERKTYWRQVSDECARMGEELQNLVEKGIGMDEIGGLSGV